MKKITKRSLRFHYPGILFSESSDVKVDTFPYRVDWPEHSFCYHRVSRTDIEDGGDIFKGEEEIGPAVYHPNSKIENLQQVRRNPNATATLISNMEINGWDRIIWTVFGQAMPFREGDTVEGGL